MTSAQILRLFENADKTKRVKMLMGILPDVDDTSSTIFDMLGARGIQTILFLTCEEAIKGNTKLLEKLVDKLLPTLRGVELTGRVDMVHKQALQEIEGMDAESIKKLVGGHVEGKNKNEYPVKADYKVVE